MFRELETLRDRFDRLFSEMGRITDLRPDGAMLPPVDVQETDEEVVVRASLPGIKPEDIEVKVDQGVLTIRGETKEERDEQKGTWHVRERRFGSVYRSIPLPAPVKDDEADAKMADGVLEIRLPKSAAPTGTRIDVKAS